MDTFIFGWISVQNWNEVRLLSFITFLQFNPGHYLYLTLDQVAPGCDQCLRSIDSLCAQYYCVLINFGFFAMHSFHTQTQMIVCMGPKNHSKSLFYNWVGKSSDFVRIAVSLRGSPTAQVSQHVFFQSKKAGL